MAANDDTFREEPKTITAKDRMEALLMATMNEENASLCAPDQPALRKVFEMNAALFRRLAS
jgi:hypothetical protein